MEKKESVLNEFNESLFGKLNRSHVTIGEYHRKKHKCRHHKEDD